MKATLDAINQMKADGVIGKYAIGGAVGATFYLEPSATLDLDIFVVLPVGRGGLLSLSPIYEYLKARGYAERDEHILIGDWPVQFLAPRDPLEEEAVAGAVVATVEGVETWVMPAEHLVAIALRTGRAKDHSRILQFIEQDAVDRTKLRDLLERHGLLSKWMVFETRYLGGGSE